jgi:hypothetical protein
VPLVNDMLSMRVRLKHSEFGGQYTNSVDGSKLGTENSDSGGVKFALRLSENYDASLSLDTARSRDGMRHRGTAIPCRLAARSPNRTARPTWPTAASATAT